MPVFAIGGEVYGIAGTLKRVLELGAECRLVFNNQYAQG
jgi:hypothetical protein